MTAGERIHVGIRSFLLVLSPSRAARTIVVALALVPEAPLVKSRITVTADRRPCARHFASHMCAFYGVTHARYAAPTNGCIRIRVQARPCVRERSFVTSVPYGESRTYNGELSSGNGVVVVEGADPLSFHRGPLSHIYGFLRPVCAIAYSFHRVPSAGLIARAVPMPLIPRGAVPLPLSARLSARSRRRRDHRGEMRRYNVRRVFPTLLPPR